MPLTSSENENKLNALHYRFILADLLRKWKALFLRTAEAQRTQRKEREGKNCLIEVYWDAIFFASPILGATLLFSG
ncbi:hypothetical protein [Nostoc sp. NMS4]|uniref:hypothetical protein n=1 Tax=Nostoc sp. NMS4 TaxID=2815390 RepID=UPI0025DF4069|nr:hypothetical protein [Nostoc sp. NMS4]MBN3921858.1 hypothetical protein [Nostoc sp. NMS4]